MPGTQGTHDMRYSSTAPVPGAKSYETGNYEELKWAYNGEKSYLIDSKYRQGRSSTYGYIHPALTPRMFGLGLTILHYRHMCMITLRLNGSSPMEVSLKKVLRWLRGMNVWPYMVSMLLTRSLCLSQMAPGDYVKLFIDPLSGFMPLKQEWYNVREVEGKLKRELSYTFSARFKKYEGEIWFPVWGSSKYKETEMVIDRVEYSLNADMPDTEFTITEWPPGTLVEDKIENTTFKVPRN